MEDNNNGYLTYYVFNHNHEIHDIETSDCIKM